MPIGHSNDAPTPILWTISSLLSGDHYRVLNLLSNILIGVADDFTDSKTVCLPFLMMEQHDLFSFSPDWLNIWDGNGTLVTEHWSAILVLEQIDAVLLFAAPR